MTPISVDNEPDPKATASQHMQLHQNSVPPHPGGGVFMHGLDVVARVRCGLWAHHGHC